MPRSMRWLTLSLLLLLPAAAPPATITSGPGLMAVEVTASPVPLDSSDPARDRVGRLRYLGGLALSSRDARFGGLSGLRWTGGGLLAVTDGGNWVAFDVAEAGDRLTGLNATRIGLIRGPQREPLKGKAHADAEGLEADETGLSVAFERDHRIWHYRNPNDAAWAEPFPDEAWLKQLPANSGIEAMARWGRDWQFFAAEATLANGRQDAVFAALHGMTRTFAHVSVPVPEGFRPTDAQALDAAHILLLSRRRGPISGDGASVQIIPLDPGRLTLGRPEEVARLEAPLAVDNMEGLTVRREGSRTFVYLVSDDNFSPLQRTLLLKFELLP